MNISVVCTIKFFIILQYFSFLGRFHNAEICRLRFPLNQTEMKQKQTRQT